MREVGTYALALLFAVTGALHLLQAEELASIVLPGIRGRTELVYLTGGLQWLAVAGLLFPRARPWAGAGLILFLVAAWPSHLYMALENRPLFGVHFGPTLLWLRVPAQLLLIVWVAACARPETLLESHALGRSVARVLRVAIVGGLALAVLVSVPLLASPSLRDWITSRAAPALTSAPLAVFRLAASPLVSEFTLGDEWPRLPISLEPVLGDLHQPTDFHFLPGDDRRLLIAEKQGLLRHADLDSGELRTVLEIDVLTPSEQGLLGLAFHPQYPEVPCLYLNYSVDLDGQATSRVSEWCTRPESVEEPWRGPWRETRIVFELAQPYRNHNAGLLLFDAAGFFYMPWGDGGSGGDPHGHGQNLQTCLGTILRVRLTPPGTETVYTIPPDNPFVNDPEIADEIWAYGLRNPWRGSFDRLGRLVLGDVGQNRWEEVTIVSRGGENHGWNTMEGLHCFEEPCDTEGLVMPVFEYGRDVGQSITGGFEALSRDYPPLHGRWIFGDFATGQLFAARLPDVLPGRAEVISLGRWPVAVSTFGRDSLGRVYLADFTGGDLYRIRAPRTHPPPASP